MEFGCGRTVGGHIFDGAAACGNQPLRRTTAHDPGPRAVAVGAGQPLAGLSSDETEYFLNGLARFIQTDSVTGLCLQSRG